MHCHLLIPNLFLTLPSGHNPFRGLRLPSLETLLARSRSLSLTADSMEVWLCKAFGMEKQRDWPIAPLTLDSDGGNPHQDYWFRADPVHLRVERDQIILADSGTLSISQVEADKLVAALNRHFETDGLLFYALRPDRWYLKPSSQPDIQTRLLPDVAGKNINDHLPTGTDGMRWHQLFNEIQMLFHDHPANEAREMRGEMPINSIWLWGGGTMPVLPLKPYSKIWARDALARSLAHASQTPVAALPENATTWLAQSGNAASGLIVLDYLRGAGQYSDVYGWQEGLKQLEQAWFTPLLHALKQGKLSSLTLHAGSESHIQSFHVTSADLWKIWRRIKPLETYTTQSSC